MINFESKYKDLLRTVLEEGDTIEGRNGTTIQLSGRQLRANLKDGFPLVTSKKIFPKSVFVETQWILEGRTCVYWLNQHGVKIWDQWADQNGELGPVYGKQLRDFNGVDQLTKLIENAKKDINSRRLLISMWNPLEVDDMNLPPCHYSWQIVHSDGYLDIIVSMRSLDLFIGAPYDIAMYATILSSICEELNLIPREVIINAASTHIYSDHIDAVLEYLSVNQFLLPELLEVPKISNFKASEVILSEYKSNKRLKVKIHK